MRRPLTAFAIVAASALLSACGSHHPNFADANNNGTYVKAGPVTYQLEVSRLLNPYLPEDSGYLQGLPRNGAGLPADEEWYGIFLWAKNQTHVPQQTTDRFVVEDTEGNKYYPIAIHNPYAWTSMTLAPGAIEPVPNTTASFGPTGGGLVLFKVPSQGVNSVYANRPLTLQIYGNTGKVWATVSLDL